MHNHSSGHGDTGMYLVEVCKKCVRKVNKPFSHRQGRTDNSWGPPGNRGSWGPCVLAQTQKSL
ncbi:unnamed protein product [Staurois parvus]|uniref:Recombination activating protein 1 n=1 Tax=Staurois parvus TaxID=386267 RepID=A0ABN9DU88_9NEOB|nr:unnamed protein product [Staurois parvus]